jgi:hypothetical protein
VVIWSPGKLSAASTLSSLPGTTNRLNSREVRPELNTSHSTARAGSRGEEEGGRRYPENKKKSWSKLSLAAGEEVIGYWASVCGKGKEGGCDVDIHDINPVVPRHGQNGKARSH